MEAATGVVVVVVAAVAVAGLGGGGGGAAGEALDEGTGDFSLPLAAVGCSPSGVFLTAYKYERELGGKPFYIDSSKTCPTLFPPPLRPSFSLLSLCTSSLSPALVRSNWPTLRPHPSETRSSWVRYTSFSMTVVRSCRWRSTTESVRRMRPMRARSGRTPERSPAAPDAPGAEGGRSSAGRERMPSTTESGRRTFSPADRRSTWKGKGTVLICLLEKKRR